MKNIFSVATVAALALGISNAQAQMTPDETKLSHLMFCGSKAQIEGYAKENGQVVSPEDIEEAKEVRSPVLKVLRQGRQGLKEILEQGSQDGTGPFGVIITCGVMMQIKTHIEASGCVDLNDGSVVAANPEGFAACQELIDKVN